MTHPSELISAYLDGEVTGSESEKLFRHVDSCGKCAADLEDLQRVRTAVRSLPILEVPEGLIPATEAEVVPIHRNRGFLVGTAAAVVALVIAVAALVTPPAPSVSVDDLSSRFGARVTLDPAFGPAKVVAPQLEQVTTE